MLRKLRNFVIDTPYEGLARRVYLRLDRSPVGLAEKDTLKVLKRCLKRDSNCIDIGAHRGSVLGEIAALSPQGRHIAFEPVPRHCRYLEKQFPQVDVRQLALSSTAGTRDFAHIVNRPTRSGFIRPPDPGIQVETMNVQVETLDHLIPADFHIDLIKLDVEGAEYQVIQGGVQTIRRNRPVLLLEFSIETSAWYGVTAAEMYTLIIETCGLHLFLTREWLNRGAPLQRSEFVDVVEAARSFYFIAGLNPV